MTAVTEFVHGSLLKKEGKKIYVHPRKIRQTLVDKLFLKSKR